MVIYSPILTQQNKKEIKFIKGLTALSLQQRIKKAGVEVSFVLCKLEALGSAGEAARHS